MKKNMDEAKAVTEDYSSDDDEDDKKLPVEEVSSKDSLKGTGTKRKFIDEDDEDKKAERRAANRRSALQSRQRRKILIEGLQKTVTDLTKENTELKGAKNELRIKLEVSQLENQMLRKHLLATSSPPGATTTAPAPNTHVGKQNSFTQTTAETRSPTISNSLGNTAGNSTSNDSHAGARLAVAASSSPVVTGGLDTNTGQMKSVTQNQIPCSTQATSDQAARQTFGQFVPHPQTTQEQANREALRQLVSRSQAAADQANGQALGQLTFQSQAALEQAARQAMTVQTTANQSVVAGQLQQYMSMLASGSQSSTEGTTSNNNLQSQQQLALLQAALNGPIGISNNNDVTRALNNLIQNLTKGSGPPRQA